MKENQWLSVFFDICDVLQIDFQGQAVSSDYRRAKEKVGLLKSLVIYEKP